MEVRSHEYVKVTRSHDGRRRARHGRRVCRHLQRRRRVFWLDRYRGLNDAIRHADDDIHDAQYNDAARGRKDRDDTAFGSAPGEALVPGYGLQLEREFRLQFGIGIQLGRERSG
jgi:hypothetical protein